MGYFEKILTLNLADYGGANFPIGIVLLCIFIGMIVATVIVQCTNRWIYRTVKALVRHKADSEESAKSPKELGLSTDGAILRALKKENAMLMRYLCIAGASETALASEKASAPAAESESNEEKDAQKKRAETNADEGASPSRKLYFLNPAMADRARELLSSAEPSVLHTVVYCLIFVALYFGLASILPLALSVIL